MAERQGSDIHHSQFTTRGDGGRVLQGSVHQRRYPSKVPDATDMKLPVTLDNYKAKFTALLYYEKQEHIELLKKKCDGCYTLEKCQPPFLNYNEKDYPNHFCCLQGISSAQIMYATQASDHCVTISIGRHNYVASILSCNYSHIDDRLYICFNKRGKSINSIRDQLPLKVYAKFDVDHSYFDGLNEGVMRISMNVLRRLIPTPEDFKSPPKNISINIRRHPHGGIDLDPEQIPALKVVLSNQCSAPVLVPGAFGCGKTRLLAVATECFFREHRETGNHSPCRILICCHHQNSADVFMDSYFSKMLTYKKHPWPVKVVRVTSSRHRVSYPGYVQAARFDNSQYKNENSFLLVTTFGGALTISRQVEPDFFTHILIDEGAQTREPEALSPFLMANENTRIVIAGDHQQVGPQILVLGKAPQQFGLCVSLLQRLLEKYKSIGHITKRNAPSWNINYRSQADILELPSKLFYNSELKDCGRVPYHLKAPYPYVFICSSFTNDIPVDAQCSVEADRLLQAVQLHSDKFKSWELKDTCIMTPSLKQANLIREQIRTKFMNLKGVNVITSYQMQGQEYRMLFMSTVESLEPNGQPFDPLKSFCNPALFNTAITRSKSLVVAVGNPLVLLLSEATMDDLKWCWREFISRCIDHETFSPFDSAQFQQVKAQLNCMLKCENPTDLIKLFQNKGYSETCSTKATTLVLPTSLSTPHLPQRSIQQSRSPSTLLSKPQSAPSMIKISPTTLQQPSEAAQSLALTKKNQSPAAKKQPSLHGEDRLASNSLSNDVQGKKSSPQKHSRQPLSNSQFKQGALESQHLPTTSIMPKKHNKSPCKQPPPVNALALKSVSTESTKQFPPDTAGSTPEYPEPCMGSSLLTNGKRTAMNAPYFQNSRKDLILKQFFMEHDHKPFDIKLLTARLTRQNYKQKFHQLLCREEEEHDRLLKERCDGFYTLSVVNGRKFKEIGSDYTVFGQIVSETLDADAIAYAHQASEGKVILHLPSGNMQADIVRPKEKDDSCLFLGFSEFLNIKRSMQVYVNFVLKYSYFDRLHKAIHNLSSSMINRLVPADCSNFTISMLKPAVSNNYPDIISLDYSQSKALETIIKCESSKAPVLVIGSFGTGKTRLLARAAYELLEKSQRNRVLICAHHQHSADSFIIDYFAKIRNYEWSSNVVRLIPSSSYNFKLTLEQYYHTWHRLSRGKERDVRLVVTTFSTSLHLYLYAHIKEGFFTHILLDEGAQTREPESIAPLCLADDNTQIVIAGDHKQVGPSLLVLGETAIQYGLSQSLLERLHHAYNSKALGRQINVFSHCSTLLTNFRCHHAILSLPSFLFYDSALMLGAEAVTHLHPLSNYPLHFICSGLSNEKEVHDTTNDFEVDLLLSKVKKYVDSWPKEWGSRNLSKVCVMTTTAHQKFRVINAIRKKASPFKCLNQIEIKTVFDIQGCEYEAIFLSTAEPTTREGKSKNPTKTPCSQYVFNTALTRAKSLVVCAGNPFLLMTIEESMGNECSCWKEYIRRCILSKTFVPLALQCTNSDQIKVLQEMIFKSPINSNANHISTKDSILKSFQRVLKSVPQYKYSKLQIIQEQSDSKWDIIDQDDSIIQYDDSEESEGHKEGIVCCELQIKNSRSAVAIPLDQSKEPIVINGLNNRRGAFNNDIVQVEVTTYTSADDSSKEVIVKTSGKVVKVIEEQHPTRYVCRADQYGFINFYPLDKTAPIIVNLPKISWKLLRDGNRKGKMEEMESGRKVLRKDQSSVVQDYITVFREESLSVSNDDPKLPRIKELIPFELSQSLLFVVEVLGWNPKYRKALGAVIEAVPRTSSLFFTNHLLSLVYDIHEDEEVCAPLQPPNETNQLYHYNRAFTIDPPLSKDLDDAVSLTPLPEDSSYELAVLIANVAKYINENHPLDKKAKQRGTSVYGAKQRGASNDIQRVHHMFPSSITSQMSLDRLKKRHVLCLPATVVIKEGVVTSVVSDNPKEAMVTSQVRFTYESAKKVMHNEEVDDETRRQVEAFDNASGPRSRMANTLNLLYKIAKYLRIKRLGDAGYCYDRSEEGEETNWQTHLLIEELMIFCNAAIADYLRERIPQQSALFLVQRPPLEVERYNFIRQNQKYLQQSLSLNYYLNDFNNEPAPFIMPNTTLQVLVDACSNGDHITLASVLSNNKLYPQLAMAEAMSRLINRKATYIVENSSEHNCNHHVHSGLLLPAYTHFTSPIRRYADLIVQRLVTSLIEGRSIAENSDIFMYKKLVKLCSQLNVRNKAAKDFERADNKACIARSCEISLERAEAFVIESSKKSNDSLELSFTSNHYECIHGQDTSFSISDLNSHHKTKDGAIVWKIVSISLNQSFNLFSHPDVIDMPSSGLKAPHCSIAAKIYQYTQGLKEREPRLHRSNSKFAVRNKGIILSSECWFVTHQYLKCQNEDNFKEVKSLILHLQQEASKDQPHLRRDEESVAITYEIQRPFTANDIVTVWLGKSLKECLPVPAVQLMEIAPTVRVCLHHNKYPSLCFSDVQLQNASLATGYYSIEQYVQLWSKVFIAESVYDSVRTKNLIFIRHAPLKWNGFSRVDNCVDDPYYVPKDEVFLVIPPKNQDSLDFISIKSGDFLCVRYEISDSLNAVYHFVVTSVEQGKKKRRHRKDIKNIIIRMCAEGDHSCRVTENMYQELKKGSQTCEIQIIPMPDSFHRVYARMKEALRDDDKWSSLSKTILISDTIRSNDFNGLTATKKELEISLKVFNYDPLAKQLWKGEGGIELNPIQQDSIKRALTNKFQLIQGPPGTGKSETGAHLAYIFSITNKKIYEEDPMSCKKKSVLYCGPSNKSVDVVHKNLHLLKALNNKLKILRIYGRTHERNDYPDPVFDLTQERTNRHDDGGGRVLDEFRDESLHEIIRHNCLEIVATESRLKELLDQGIIPSLDERNRYKKLITFEEMKEIQNNYDVILCTCNETCSQRLLSSKDILAQCIIDESGMATEPETIAASSLCEHVVLIGDHKQLQPVVKYSPAKECGLGTSLFERYANQFEEADDPHLITLELQYRMHSFICQGPSNIFYDGKLKADQIVQDRGPLTQSMDSFWPRGQLHPVLFLKVYGMERSTDYKYSRKVDSHSKCNDEEAEAVVNYIKMLVKEHDVKHDSIAVLTPYGAQKNLVAEMIKNDPELKTKESLSVATIVESQGDEYDIVILTTVRSQEVSEIRYKQYVQPDRQWLNENLGFLTDDHQINVGITRARYGLIIIGNDILLKYDATWNKLIEIYENEGCIHTV